MTVNHTPAVTRTEFDALESDLRRDLERWWEDEKSDLEADLPPADLTTDPLWDGVPEIDSKAVVKASPVVRRHTGADLDPKLIRKGGYKSFDDLAGDLLPKLRESCPESHPIDVHVDVVPIAEGATK
jgi:hypothetical protein